LRNLGLVNTDTTTLNFALAPSLTECPEEEEEVSTGEEVCIYVLLTAFA
jgi:hypothetical protein